MFPVWSSPYTVVYIQLEIFLNHMVSPLSLSCVHSNCSEHGAPCFILNVNPTILSVNLMYVLRFTALNALMKINVISFALTIFNDHGQIIRWFPKKLCQWFLVGRLAHVVGRLAHVSGQISSWSGQISSCQWAD